jgi:hypothetical protein
LSGNVPGTIRAERHVRGKDAAAVWSATGCGEGRGLAFCLAIADSGSGRGSCGPGPGGRVLLAGGLVNQLTPRHTLAVGTLAVAFGGVGVIVARRQPCNRMGWILLGFVALLLFGRLAGSCAVLDYRAGHHGLPLAPVAVVLANTVLILALLSAPLIILLFPDGQLPGRRWRRVLWVYAGLVACVMTLAGANAIAAVADHDIRVDASGNLTSSGHLPGWVASPPVWLGAVVVVGW